jgi:hypothetical protein
MLAEATTNPDTLGAVGTISAALGIVLGALAKHYWPLVGTRHAPELAGLREPRCAEHGERLAALEAEVDALKRGIRRVEEGIQGVHERLDRMLERK